MAVTVNTRDLYLQSGSRSQSLSLIVNNTVNNLNIDIRVVNATGINLVQYVYKKGDGVLNSYATATTLQTTGSPQYTWTAQVAGIYVIWVVGIDINGNETAPVSTTVNISAPNISSISASLNGPNLKLDWAIATGDMAIDYYEIRYGTTWIGATLVGTTKATTYTTRVDYSGSTRVWWVAAKSLATTTPITYSDPVSKSVTINAPSAVVENTIKIEIVDNNALIKWEATTLGTGQLPIDYYQVRKGETFGSSTLVGSNGNSTFTSVFEQASGTYTYWIVGYDTAGVAGTAVSKSATISQPPDYVLRNNYNSTFTGTSTNLYLEQGYLVGPVNTTQTWSTHFVAGAGSGSWATPGDQVSAGYPIYIAPNISTGTYEEIIDYGTNTVISTTGTVGSITGSGPWTSTISGMTTTTGLAVGSVITVTAGSGTLYNGVNYAVVASIVSSTSITCTTTGGTTPTAGTITNITLSTTIPSTVLTTTLSTATVSGGVTVTCVISHKMVAADAWTVLSAATSALLPTFRYARVVFTLTPASTPGSNLIKLTGLNIKLSIKLRTDSGTGTYNNALTDAQNFKNFGYNFLSADTPIVQVTTLTSGLGTAVPLTPLVIYDGGSNPTGFSVRLYDRTGATQSGVYSWTVRGY